MKNDRHGHIDIFQFLLFVTGIFTFGFLDGYTATQMMTKYGVIAEYNPMFRYISMNYGLISFMLVKMAAVSMVLSTPLLMQWFSRDSMYWMTNGFLGVFTVSGLVAAIDNYSLLENGAAFADPKLIMGITLVCVFSAIYLGDALDQKRNRKNRQNFKISDDEWQRMKYEMGYPA
ncbi:MAG: hypothetical protein SVY15_09130 [Halobacteriota archaeon]|nr:hypothetical protein [Halobacteriota archaeon]